MTLRLAVAGAHLDGFSGIPRHLIAALREHADVTEWPLPHYRPAVAKRVLVRLRERNYLWEKEPRRNTFYSHAIDARASAERPDAVLVFGSEACAYTTTSVPLFAFGDSIFGSRVGLYDDQRSISARSIAEGVEMQQRGLDRLHTFFCTSRWAWDRAVERFGYRVDADKLCVTGIGANLPHVWSAATAVTALAGPERKRLLWVGVDWNRKRGDFAIAVVEALRMRAIDAQLDIVGPVDVPARAPWITAHGKLTASAGLGEAYARASALLLPTMADLTPIVISEAAMYGRSTFATPVGGIPEMIQDGVTGMLIDSEDPRVWADAIANANLDALGTAARLRYEQRLNWNVIAATMVERMRSR